MPISTWRRLFRRHDAITEAVERAVEAQAAFERTHPVTFDAPTRLAALLERAAIAYGAPIPPAGWVLIEKVGADWVRASKAAEETP